MFKFIGAVMIMLSGIGWGNSFSSRVKKHIRDVEAVNSMFAEVVMMINFNAVTFRELILHLKECPQTKKLKFLNEDLSSVDIRDCILESLKKNADNFGEEEVAQLCSFFMQLGLSDLEGQLLMAEKYREYFRIRLERLREESIKKCRLYNSLGALGGAFIAVILI